MEQSGINTVPVDNDKEPEEQNTDGLKKTERIKPD